MQTHNSELEATLVVISGDPQSIMKKISSESAFAGYPLLSKGKVEIHDTYFDTADRMFGKNDLIFRIRQKDQSYQITFKGPPRKKEEGFAERLEIEDKWSQENLVYVMKELRKRNIQMPELTIPLGNIPPVEYIKKLGMKVIQYRENHRNIVDVISSDDESVRLAEMVFDTIVYHLDNNLVRHHEIEIESKSLEGYKVLKDVVNDILSKYQNHVRKWNYGKLITGQAIRKLLREGKSGDILKDDGSLKPSVYKLLEHYLKLL